MKSYAQFLIEATMSPTEAMQILGLSAGFTKDDLKKAYRAAAIKAHPDRGGDTSAMQRVNAANDVLERVAGTTAARVDYETHRAAWAERDKAFYEVARARFDELLDLSKFAAHFAKVFGGTFTQTINKTGEYQNSGSWFEHRAEWANKDKTTVLYLRIGVNYQEMHKGRVLSSPDNFLTMSVLTEILHNRKKVKLGQRDYKVDNRTAVLNDPEVTFPAAKLKTQSTKASQRATSARDIVITFERELGAVISGSGKDMWVYVPVGDYSIALTRNTFLGSGSWAINGVYAKHGGRGGRVAVPGYHSFLEKDTDDLPRLFDFLKGLQHKTWASADALNTAVSAYVKHEYEARQAAFKAKKL